MRNISGVIAIHGDFFQDDVAFLLQLGRINHSGGDHIGDDVDGHGQVGIKHPCVVAGALFGCCRIGFPANLVKGGGDFHRGAALGALEQQMFKKMGGAVLALGFIPRANTNPEPDCRAALPRHGLGQDPHASRQDGTAHYSASHLTGNE